MATPRKTTLLNLVQAVSDYATSDTEVVATVAYLINSGKVQLCGNFAGAKITLPYTVYGASLLMSEGSLLSLSPPRPCW
jgi:hypothetical protein